MQQRRREASPYFYQERQRGKGRRNANPATENASARAYDEHLRGRRTSDPSRVAFTKDSLSAFPEKRTRANLEEKKKSPLKAPSLQLRLCLERDWSIVGVRLRKFRFAIK